MRFVLRLILLLSVLFLISSCSQAVESQPETFRFPVPVLDSVGGDFPVAALSLLPDGQQNAPVGYLDTQLQLDRILANITPSGSLSQKVDFETQIVLFARNTNFYNRISIGQVLFEGETLKLVAMETMSARPIRDKVAISLVVIPRGEAKYLDVRGERLAID